MGRSPQSPPHPPTTAFPTSVPFSRSSTLSFTTSYDAKYIPNDGASRHRVAPMPRLRPRTPCSLTIDTHRSTAPWCLRCVSTCRRHFTCSMGQRKSDCTVPAAIPHMSTLSECRPSRRDPPCPGGCCSVAAPARSVVVVVAAIVVAVVCRCCCRRSSASNGSPRSDSKSPSDDDGGFAVSPVAPSASCRRRGRGDDDRGRPPPRMHPPTAA